MTGKPSMCSMCGRYFASKVELKRHIYEMHSITNDRIRKRKGE